MCVMTHRPQGGSSPWNVDYKENCTCGLQHACAEGKESYLARRLLEERENPPPQLPVKSWVELEGGRPLAPLRDSTETRRRGQRQRLVAKVMPIIFQRDESSPVRLHRSVCGREAQEAQQLSPPAALHPRL